jgi:uncharacterized membrane protein/thiol-disulfide isomerase/thioredoxin
MYKRVTSFHHPIICLAALLASLIVSPVSAQQAVVRAVIFFSPSCGHCHLVITETLLPMMEEYGDQLQIIGIDISTEEGSSIFSATLQAYGLEQGGVPFLLVGDHILVGSLDIPEQFPSLVEDFLAKGGVAWPAIPGLAETLAAMEIETAETTAPEPTIVGTQVPENTPAGELSTPDTSPTPDHTPTPATASLISADGPGSRPLTVAEKVGLDPLGNLLSILILVAMVLVVIYLALTFHRPAVGSHPIWQEWAVPILCLVGLVVAGYLAYVETAHVTAVCGPVGDCNTVQQSEYAILFGVLPVGLIGLVGYVAILAVWLVAEFALGRLKAQAWLAIFGMSMFGTLFSIFLTFLEPFVLGATCAWCLSSAVLITMLLWLSSMPAKEALTLLLRSTLKSRKAKISHNVSEG